MMRQDRARLMRCAAALQYVAAEFRAHAALAGSRPADLERFAGLLDHMAASVITAPAGRSETEPYLLDGARVVRLIPAAGVGAA